MALRKVRITIIEMGEGTNSDGVEEQYTAVGYSFADFERVNGFKDLSAGRLELDESVRLTFLKDSSYSINIKMLIEFENRQYSLSDIEHGDLINGKFVFNPSGKYWRVTGRSRDYG